MGHIYPVHACGNAEYCKKKKRRCGLKIRQVRKSDLVSAASRPTLILTLLIHKRDNQKMKHRDQDEGGQQKNAS